MRRTFIALALLGPLVVVGCGSSSSKSGSTSSPAKTATTVAVSPIDGPSLQAKMVCTTETQTEIAGALGVKATGPAQSGWAKPDFTCTFRYANGVMRLRVRDQPDLAATKVYFNQLAGTLGRGPSIEVGGDQSVSLKNGGVLARKDRHVLYVDTTGLPASFGKPPTTRAQAAYSVAGVIMACWKGDNAPAS